MGKIMGYSNQGLRESQEDAFGFHDAVLVLADGMGGHADGEVASRIAVDTMLEELCDGSPKTDDDVLESFVWTARQISEATDRGGTTLVVACITGDVAFIAWVGDSSAFFFNASEGFQITSPHVDASGRLTRWLPDELRPEWAKVELDAGDCLVLCTDGVTDVLEEGELAVLLDMEDAAQWMVEEALEAGSSDNCTVVVYRHT